jgi:hypothetical protein
MQSLSTQIACFLSSGEEFLLKEDYIQALDLFENALAMAQQNQDLQAEALALHRWERCISCKTNLSWLPPPLSSAQHCF